MILTKFTCFYEDIFDFVKNKDISVLKIQKKPNSNIQRLKIRYEYLKYHSNVFIPYFQMLNIDIWLFFFDFFKTEMSLISLKSKMSS